MLIISSISKASFRHVQGTTSHDLWLSLKKVYAPHSTYREYTLKTQLLRIEMHGNETPNAYLNRAQEYVDVLAAIDDPVKDKDLVMLTVSGHREEYKGLKTTITVRQSPTAFSELHALLSDHDYMLGKTRAPAPSITSSFAANYAVGSPSMPEACQAQISELTAQLSALGFQVSPIAPSANSHVTPDLEAMDNSEAYYGDDALYVGNAPPIMDIVVLIYLPSVFILLDIPSSPRSPISSPSSVSHLSPTSQTSLESSNGQPSPVSTASIPTPPPPTPPLPTPPPPPPPPITRLKQAPRAWFERLSKSLFDLGNHKGTIDNIICQLVYAFALKDIGPLNYFLEAEYNAIADTVAELTWLQALLNELGIYSSLTPILWCDNLGATYLSANPIFHARIKHVEIDNHFIWEKIAQGDLRVQHISTHDQIADIFTKPLPTPRFLFLRSKLQDPSKVTEIELTAHMIDVNNRRDSVSPPLLVAKPKKGKSQTITLTLHKSQGLEASRALSKKSKRPKSKKPPIETKVTPPKPTKGSEQSHSVSSGTVPDSQDLERDIQLASIGLPSTLDEALINQNLCLRVLLLIPKTQGETFSPLTRT
ncbi:nucleotide-binding alpha-beta plait domain-containing protein [Tanacetum coccineum]|uniref:Nucleotide-binding alpha-beta plait domain-containing protein n=1 Tax=Tanacetum coccineum TaxID=301880 RepID=A0ABQ4YIX7_9ASTR